MGKLLLLTLNEQEEKMIEKIIAAISDYMQNESKLSFSGIEVYPERRKIYCNSKEIHLTAKEYRLLFCLNLRYSNLSKVS